jgi:malate/lactate dehydrogenase
MNIAVIGAGNVGSTSYLAFAIHPVSVSMI